MEVSTEMIYLGCSVVSSFLAGLFLWDSYKLERKYNQMYHYLLDKNTDLQLQNENLQEQIEKMKLLTVNYLEDMSDLMDD